MTVTVVPQDRTEGARCVIVKPGDVLILVGIEMPTPRIGDFLNLVKEELGLRMVIACESLDGVAIRDVDAELARLHEQGESYAQLFEMQQAQLNKTLDQLDEARRQLAAHQTGDAKEPHE